MISYFVKTDVSTFTRKSKSDRKYTHIVVSKRSDKRVAEVVKYFAEFEVNAAANPSEYPPVYCDARRREHAAFLKSIGEYVCNGFCGRLELARSLAGTVNKLGYHQDIRIYTVEGERIS